jgi:mono/diheme cytochrome c family protein
MISLLGMAALCLIDSKASGRTAGDGTATFKAKCVMCHGADGSGSTPVGKSMKIPDLRSAAVQGQSDGQLAAAIANGKGKMPAYNKSLSPEQIQQLVAFIRGLK